MPSPTPEQVRKVVDAYVDAYRRNDRQAVLDLFAPDAEFHDPVGQPAHVGHAGIGAFWDQAHQLADRIVLEPRDVVVCGTEAAMVLEIHATIGDGGMVIDAVETFEIDDDGRIRRLKAYWDGSRARPQG
jgi:steroid delta-isomerase